MYQKVVIFQSIMSNIKYHPLSLTLSRYPIKNKSKSNQEVYFNNYCNRAHSRATEHGCNFSEKGQSSPRKKKKKIS